MKEVLAKAESKMGKTIARLESDYAAIRKSLLGESRQGVQVKRQSTAVSCCRHRFNSSTKTHFEAENGSDISLSNTSEARH